MIKVELVSIDIDKEKAEAKIEISGSYNQIKNEVYSLMDSMRKNENDLYRLVMGQLLRDDMISLMPEIAGVDFSKVFKKED